MKNQKREQMELDAAKAIIEVLEDGYKGYYEDLHNEVFNTDYYIIGIYEAEQALNEYDVFEALGEVWSYEKDNFGEVYTDITKPERLINMLFYIIGEEVLYGLQSFTNKSGTATDEENQEIINEIKNKYNL